MKKYKLVFNLFLIFSLVTVLFIGSLNLFYISKNQSTTTSVQTGGVVDGSGNALVSGKVYPMSKTMTFSAPSNRSTTATDGVIVEAFVKPEGLENNGVDWSISWVNAESDFAKDKDVSSYVSITPVDNTKVQVKCLEGFSEQINLTATSQLDSTKSATCVIDYAKRVVGFSMYSHDKLTSIKYDFVDDMEITCAKDLCDSRSSFYFLSSPDFVRSDIGTIVPDNYIFSYSRSFSQNYMDIINNYLSTIEVLESSTTIFGETIVKELALDSAPVLCFAEDGYTMEDDGFILEKYLRGALLDDIYIVGHIAEGQVDGDMQYVASPLINHPELVDLLIEEYKSDNGSVPFMTFNFSYVDDYSSYYVNNVKIYLSGSALEYHSISVDLNNDNLVM